MSSNAIVIRAFTEERLPATRAAIESARAQSLKPDEVLVVIDYNENLLSTLRSTYADVDDVRVVPNTRTKGIGGGSNTALLSTDADIVAFLDDDAVADQEWFESLLSIIESRPSVVGVGGRTEPNWLEGAAPDWFPGSFKWVVGCSNDDGREQASVIRNVWGGNNALRRDVLVAHGGFVETGLGRVGSRPVGCEDTEMCIRIRQQRPETTFVYQPLARIAHEIPGERATIGYFGSRCFFEGISKALLAARRGARDSLDEEVDYTKRVLTADVAASFKTAIRKRDPKELRTAAAIGYGLTCAATGLIYGRLMAAVGRVDVPPNIEGPLHHPT